MNIESVKRVFLWREALCVMGSMRGGWRVLSFHFREMKALLFIYHTKDYELKNKNSSSWRGKICHYERDFLLWELSRWKGSCWKRCAMTTLVDNAKLIFLFCIIGDFPSTQTYEYGNEFSVDKHQTKKMFIHSILVTFFLSLDDDDNDEYEYLEKVIYLMKKTLYV